MTPLAPLALARSAAIIVPLSAPDVGSRLSALRPVTAERRASRATGLWHRRWGTRLRPRPVEQLAISTRNLDSTGAAAGGPDTQRTPFRRDEGHANVTVEVAPLGRPRSPTRSGH